MSYSIIAISKAPVYCMSVSIALTKISLVKFSETSWWDFYVLAFVHYYPLKMAKF